MNTEKHAVLCGKRIISICETKEIADILATACNDNAWVVKILGIHTVQSVSDFDFTGQVMEFVKDLI